jgi:aspartate aminotransferase-like enzyme
MMVHRDGINRAQLRSLAAVACAAKKLFERSEFLFGLGQWLSYWRQVQQCSFKKSMQRIRALSSTFERVENTVFRFLVL